MADWETRSGENYMAHFTELNLQGKQDPKAGQNTTKTSQPLSAPGVKSGDLHPADKPKPNTNHSDSEKLSNMQKRMALIGSMAAIALIAVTFVETSGCSKAANNSATPAPAPMAAVQTPATPVPAAATPVSTATPAPAKKTAKKAARKIPTAMYKNSDYGISFRYPTYDSFKDGVWNNVESIPMNFSQPGGTALGTVELPNDMYPGTDYASAFFSASVNSSLTEDQCAEFSSTSSSGTSDPSARTFTPHKVKLGSTEYSEVEVLAGDAQQTDAKYYHTFQNGKCYEFALGLETSGSDAGDNTTPVKRSQVFPHLKWMLSTVAIKPVSTPEVASSSANPPAKAEGKASNTTDSAVNTSETKASDATATAVQSSEAQTPEAKTPEAKVIEGSK